MCSDATKYSKELRVEKTFAELWEPKPLLSANLLLFYISLLFLIVIWSIIANFQVQNFQKSWVKSSPLHPPQMKLA